MAADDSKTLKSDFMMSVFDFTVAGASSGFIKHSARTLVFSSDYSIWHCCTMPTLYASAIAREVKM